MHSDKHMWFLQSSRGFLTLGDSGVLKHAAEKKAAWCMRQQGAPPEMDPGQPVMLWLLARL